MGLVIRLHDIVSPNQFKVYYKRATSPYPMNSGYSLYGTFSAGTTTVNVSGITINFNSNYWFKIEDQSTGRYIIENIETNDPIAYMDCCPQPVSLGAVCYHSCYPPTINSISCGGLANPTPTPTITPTPTATSIVPTATPTPTPTPTATLVAPTATPTPTPTPLPGCGDTLTGTYIPAGFTIQTTSLDLSEATDESTISVAYVAYDRPNRFNIYGNGFLVANSGWVGADNTYAGPWGDAGSLTDPDGTGSFTFTYQSGMSYELRVDVGPANPLADPANPSDGWSATFTCLGAPASTPTPTPTPTPTATPTSPPLYGYFRSGGQSSVTTFCQSPGYVTSGQWFSTGSTFTSAIAYLRVYEDMNYTPFNGSDLWYAVTQDDAFNTLTGGQFNAVQIDTNGYIISTSIRNCSGGGNGNGNGGLT